MAIKNHLLAEACRHYVIFLCYKILLMCILASSLNTVSVVAGCTGIVSRTLKQSQSDVFNENYSLYTVCET